LTLNFPAVTVCVPKNGDGLQKHIESAAHRLSHESRPRHARTGTFEKWEAARIFTKKSRPAREREKFVLHDGPPFANGDVHIGTALNKILKDIIVKYQTLRGKSAPYVPGWDCHGLPIEFKVSQEMRKAGDTKNLPIPLRHPQSLRRLRPQVH
jgi:isoleucyl-tRNA synthetase